MKLIISLLTISMVVGFSSFFSPQDEIATATPENDPLEVFEQRIMPIFRSPKPSSCVQCHLSAVDLKNYILPSHEKTFVSLRDQGLIDLKNPKDSKILQLIAMGDKDRDQGAKLIHEKMRNAEYEAFANWIEACCSDEKLRSLPALKKEDYARPEKSDAIIAHGRKSRIVNSFVRNVWSQRMRCFPCHTPNEIRPNQKPARKKFEEFEARYGEQMVIFKKTPMETVKYLIENSAKTKDGNLPLINLDDPTQSLLVLKPTAKLPKQISKGKFEPPSYKIPVSHMGGLKMHMDDQSYKSFVAWIKDYAKVAGDQYTSVKDLPADNWFATKKIIRLKDAPESWGKGTPVQLVIYTWNQKSDAWNKNAHSFTQGTITPRRIANGALFLLSPTDDKEFQAWRENRRKFAAGKYLVKVYVDLRGVLKKDPTVMLGDEDYQGQIEFDVKQWPNGFPKGQWVSAKDLEN